MTTITSSSKYAGLTAMLRHDLRRTRLMSALFFLLEFIALPLQLALLLFSRPERGFALRTATYAQIYGNLSAVLFPMVIMLSAAVIAMQLMNYNFGRRSVDVYYALPFTRRQMILSHLIAGTLAISVPIVLNLAITAGLALVINPAVGLGWLAKDLLLWILVDYCVFISIMLTATLMGNAVDTVLYAGMLNLEPVLLFLAVLATLGSFVIGFDPSSLLNRNILYFHPIPMLLTQIFSDSLVGLSRWAVGLWAVLIISGTLLTVWFYSHRDAELAENVSRDNWFRLILKITSSFLLATVFAYMIFAVITTGGIYRSPSEEMAFVLGSAAGAVIGYLVLEVIFGRGFKTVRGNWWICLADIVLAAGIALMAVTGLFGYETAVPSVASVEYAEVDGYLNSYYRSHSGLDIQDTVHFTDEKAIESLTQLHQSAIAAAQYQAAEGNPEYSTNARLRVVYHLYNGSTVTRSYYGLALPEDGAEQFRDLYSTAEALEQKNPVMQIGKDEVRLGDITVMNLSGVETLVSDSQTERLLEAVRQDIFDTAAEKTNQSGEPLIYLNIGYYFPQMEYYYDSTLGESQKRRVGEGSDAIQLPIYESFDQTLTLLEELGIQGEAFDPSDYIAVYGVYDHYDLWMDSATFRANSGLAYYWVGDYQIMGETYSGLADDPSTMELVDVEWSDTPSQPAGKLTAEEIQMLYDLSSPCGDGEDEYSNCLLLFDTGITDSDGRNHLMLIRFIQEETLAALDTDLLERMTLSVETDADGQVYIGQNNSLYLNNWPQANQD